MRQHHNAAVRRLYHIKHTWTPPAIVAPPPPSKRRVEGNVGESLVYSKDCGGLVRKQVMPGRRLGAEPKPSGESRARGLPRLEKAQRARQAMGVLKRDPASEAAKASKGEAKATSEGRTAPSPSSSAVVGEGGEDETAEADEADGEEADGDELAAFASSADEGEGDSGAATLIEAGGGGGGGGEPAESARGQKRPRPSGAESAAAVVAIGSEVAGPADVVEP